MSWSLTRGRVESPDHALIYMAECTLATIEHLSDKSRPPKFELERQISIAQDAIDWIRMFGLEESAKRSPRVAKVLNHYHGAVKAWVGRNTPHAHRGGSVITRPPSAA